MSVRRSVVPRDTEVGGCFCDSSSRLPFCFSVGMIDQNKLGNKVFGLHFYLKIHHWSKLGKELKMERGGRNWEKNCSLASFFSLAQQWFLCPGVVYHSGLILSVSTRDQEITWDLPIRQSYRGKFLKWGSIFLGDYSFVNLTKTYYDTWIPRWNSGQQTCRRCTFTWWVIFQAAIC